MEWAQGSLPAGSVTRDQDQPALRQEAACHPGSTAGLTLKVPRHCTSTTRPRHSYRRAFGGWPASYVVGHHHLPT